MTSVSKYGLTAVSLAVACLASTVSAQYRRAAPGRQRPSQPGRADVPVQIRKIDAVDRTSRVRTPDYRSNVAKGRKAPGEWWRVMVQYQSEPEWIDELTFRYYLLSLTEEEGERKYSLYRKTIRYVDVEQGRDKLSEVYLHPHTIKRYGDVVAAAVEIVHDGEVVAKDSETTVNMPQGDWWTNPAVVDNENVTVRDNYLLNRNETPFAFVNVDDYEVIQ